MVNPCQHFLYNFLLNTPFFKEFLKKNYNFYSTNNFFEQTFKNAIVFFTEQMITNLILILKTNEFKFLLNDRNDQTARTAGHYTELNRLS